MPEPAFVLPIDVIACRQTCIFSLFVYVLISIYSDRHANPSKTLHNTVTFSKLDRRQKSEQLSYRISKNTNSDLRGGDAT